MRQTESDRARTAFGAVLTIGATSYDVGPVLTIGGAVVTVGGEPLFAQPSQSVTS